jgi:hypothetical protein
LRWFAWRSARNVGRSDQRKLCQGEEELHPHPTPLHPASASVPAPTPPPFREEQRKAAPSGTSPSRQNTAEPNALLASPARLC